MAIEAEEEALHQPHRLEHPATPNTFFSFFLTLPSLCPPLSILLPWLLPHLLFGFSLFPFHLHCYVRFASVSRLFWGELLCWLGVPFASFPGAAQTNSPSSHLDPFDPPSSSPSFDPLSVCWDYTLMPPFLCEHL